MYFCLKTCKLMYCDTNEEVSCMKSCDTTGCKTDCKTDCKTECAKDTTKTGDTKTIDMGKKA